MTDSTRENQFGSFLESGDFKPKETISNLKKGRLHYER